MLKNHLLLLVLALLLYSFNTIAQKDSTHKTSRWSVGLVVSPDIDYRFTSNPSLPYYGTTNSDKPRPGCTAGFNVNYMFSRLLGLELGIHYTTMGYKAQLLAPINMPGSGFVYNSSFRNEITTQNLNFLDIPIKINIFIGKGKWRYIGSLGASYSYQINEVDISTINYNNGSISKYKNTNKDPFYENLILATVSSGFAYMASGHITLRVEPTFRCVVVNISESYSTSTNLFSAGIAFGVYYHF